MRIIKATISMLESRTLVIGFQAENQRTQVRIDCAPIFAEYPHATPSLAIKPPSGETYPVFVDRDGDEVVWTILSGNLALVGDGELQLTFVKDSVIAKTVIGHIRILRSLVVSGEIPDPVAQWIDDANAKLAEVDAAIVSIDEMDAVASGLPEGADPTVEVSMVDDHKRLSFGIPKGDTGDKGDKGDKGDRGEVGATPQMGIGTVQTLPAGSEATASMSGTTENPLLNLGIPKGDKGDKGDTGEKGDKGDTGATGAQGPKGDKGDRGEKGEQGPKGDTGSSGVSPTISVTDIAGGHRITITDATGAHSFDVMDGDVADVPVQDVQVNGVSVLQNGVANIPTGTGNRAGVVQGYPGGGTQILADGRIMTYTAEEADIKAGTHTYRSIAPRRQHQSVFYGLAKAAGDTTQSASSNAVGNYTDNAKNKIQQMLGISDTIDDLKSAINIFDIVYSPNLIDETKITNGSGIYKNGNTVSGSYKHTDYIPVEAGEKYYFTLQYGSQGRQDGNIRFLACYDESKAVMESAGSNDNITSFPYTVPEGVAYVILSFSNNATYKEYQFEKGETPTTYHSYGIISKVIEPEYLPIDSTLAVQNAVPDSKAVGDRINEVENQISGFIPADGIEQVTPQNLQILDTVFSPNLYNPSTVTDGIWINPSTGAEGTGNYLTTDYIPVEAGEKYYGTWQLGQNETNRGDMTYTSISCYNSSKELMGSAGTTSVTNPYTVPSGVAYIRISQTNNSYYKNKEFEKSETATSYVPYGSIVSSKVKDQYLDNSEIEAARGTYLSLGNRLDAMEEEIEELTPTDETCFNMFEFSKWTDGYIKSDGTLTGSTPATASSTYATSEFIEAKKGDTFVCSARGQTQYNSAVVPIGYYAEYDANKSLLRYVSDNQYSATVQNANAKYTRITVRIGTYGSTLKVEKNQYGLFTSYQNNTVYKGLVKPNFIFIPKYIYAAVGRTIEIYNDQIVLDNEGYHIQYISTIGTAMKRKFTFTATSAMLSNRSDSSLSYGQYRLFINIYNLDNQLVWQGASLIWVKAALNSAKTVIPIGDSLTNWKKWLPECIYLSSNNLTFVGTRYSGADQDSEGNSYASGTIHHEGRSGWSAASYLANTEYTFDNRYDGVSGVSGSANPFWDGTAFSLEHYLTTQEKSTPTAIQIWLGTNDIAAGIEPSVQNIVSLVASIRAEYPSLKILVCNTIYRSNQDGYGSVGSDAYSGGTGALAYAYSENIKIMELANRLTMALLGMENVYVVPLYCSHDSEYNFGWNEYHPNPRAEQIVHIPSESVHPATQGYWQLADILFSAYSVLL